MKRVISFLLTLTMFFCIITSVDLSAYAEEITTDDLREQMDWSVFELEYLMNTLYVDGEQLNGQKDLYEAVRTENFFHREIYDIYSSDPLFEAVTVFKVQTLNDEVNLISNPHHFYSVVLMDILQNEELKYFNDDALKSDMAVHSAKALEKAYGTIAKETIESLGASNYEEMLNLPWKDFTYDMKKVYIESWEETYKYSDTLKNLDLVGKMLEAGDTLLDCINKLTSLYAVADYNAKTVELLDDMYKNTSNVYLKMAINDIKDIYKDLSSPEDLQSIFENGVYGQTFEYTCERIAWFAIKTAVEFFFSDVLAAPLLAWEIGTSVAEMLFAITDSATCYMTLEAATLIEDELRVIMKQYRTAYEKNKTPENAQKCREAYRLTLANVYYAANTIQELGYAVSGNGSLWGTIKTLCGSDDYGSFVTICDSTRSIVKTRYYKYSQLARKLYSALYGVNFEETEYNEIPLNDFTFNEDQITLKVGDVYTIFTNNIPSNANNVDVFPKYESSASSVATVNSLGAVIAKTPGTATITVTKNDISKQLIVKVEADESSATAFGTCGKNLTWSFYESTGTLIISGRGAMDDFGSRQPWDKYMDKITKVVIGNDITSISSYAFYDCKGLETIKIPDGVKNIDEYAFCNCTGLTSVTIGNGVTSIGSSAFSGCTGLISVKFGNNVTSIGFSAFKNCENLTSVIIGNSVTKIGSSAFYGCSSLASITIGDNVTAIDSSAFHDTQFYNDSSNWENNVLYIGKYLIEAKKELSGDYTIKKGTKVIAYYAFKNCDLLKSVIIPNSVISINSYGFSDCNLLESVTIPDSVTSIGAYAFSNCDLLESVTISDNVTSINSGTFSDCDLLESVTIPDSVTTIEDRAFSGCDSLKKAIIGNGVVSIDEFAFSSCLNLKELTMPVSAKIYSQYTFNNSTNIEKVILTKGTGIMQNYGTNSSLTATDTYYQYTPWYISRNKIKEIIIEDGVKSVGDYAFYDCTGLTTIIIPDSVTSIGSSAFSGCTGLTSVTIGNSVTHIGFSALSGCTGLTTIIIPDSVTNIGSSAFSGCTGLTSVTIGKGVTSIGYYAFNNCKNLVNVYYNGDVESWCGITFDSNSSTPMTYAKNFYINNTLVEEIIIPDTVTNIKNYAFFNFKGITSVTIGNGVTSICDDAFYNCENLVNVYYNGDIESWCEITFSGYYSNPMIYAKSFYINNKLVEEIIIPDTVTNIKDYAFYSFDGITSVTIPDSVTSIGSSAFYGCIGLTTATISNGVTSIAYRAFMNCEDLTSVTIGKGVTSIGDDAFCNCTSLSVTYFTGTDDEWDEIIVGSDNYYLTRNIIYKSDSEKPYYRGVCGENLEYALYINGDLVITGSGEMTNYSSYSQSPWYSHRSEIKSVALPEGLTSIGNWAFDGCTGLTTITIPDGVTEIGTCAFNGCTGLTSFTIGKGVTSIGNAVFSNCNNLVDVYYNGDIESWCGIIFNGGYCSNPMEGAKNFYINNTLLEEVVIPDTVTKINDYAFKGCTSLTSVTIGNSVTSIGNLAFSGCTGLMTIIIPDSVTRIGNSAFSGCTSLTSVTIGDGAKSIGNSAFSGCKALKSVTIGNRVTNIGDSAFNYCENLTTIILPDSVTSIGDSAFNCCNNLVDVYYNGDIESWCGITFDSNSSTPMIYAKNFYINNTLVEEIIIPDTVTNIKDYAFYSFDGITSVTIPDSVTSIGSSAFYGCIGLTTVTIPNSVTSIGSKAFYNCNGLKAVTIGNSVTSIGDSAFSYCTNLNATCFTGTEAEWNKIKIGSYNTNLTKNIFYESTIEETPRCKGSCGENLEYVLYMNGDLVITGSGEMTNYTAYSPWYSYYSEIKSVSLPDGLSHIGNRSFYCCKGLTTITIPDSVISIGSYAFSNCEDLISVTIGDGVTSIGDYAFNYCKRLTSITISNSVTSIAYGAFMSCDSLADVYYNGTEADWNKISIDSANEDLTNATIHFIDDVHEHSYTTSISKAPTCTEKGEETCTCSCGDTYTKEIAALNHIPGDVVKENKVVATCMKGGSYDSVVYCSVCSAELSRETVETPIGGHVPDEAVRENVIEPECKKRGLYDSVVYCSECGIELSREKNILIPALGHKPGEAVEEVTQATCVTDGLIEAVVYCTVCKKEISRETTATISAHGEHTSGKAVEENRIEPICTEDGSYDMVVYCMVCEVEISRENIRISHTGHKAGEPTEGNRIEPSCTTDGSSDMITYCFNCGEELTRETIIIPAYGHTEVDVVEENRIEPTCTEKGSYDLIVYCSVCGVELSNETKSISATGHKWEDWEITTQPTTTTDGVKTRVCSVCGESESGVEPKTGITVMLADADGIIVSEQVIEDNLTEITFEDIEDGEYTVTVSKATYVSREYTVTAAGGEASVAFKLNHVGDVNGDGKISVVDYTQLLRHVKKTSSLDGYAFDCSDVNGDGRISVLDYTKLLRHVKKTEMLW